MSHGYGAAGADPAAALRLRAARARVWAGADPGDIVRQVLQPSGGPMRGGAARPTKRASARLGHPGAHRSTA